MYIYHIQQFSICRYVINKFCSAIMYTHVLDRNAASIHSEYRNEMPSCILKIVLVLAACCTGMTV